MSEPWLVSASGKCISVEHPRVQDIELFDVARGLADERRYGNRLETNVAHHSCMVSGLAWRWARDQKHDCPQMIALAALFHDASEAYLGDVISPIKKFLPDYAKLERYWMAIIAAQFGFDPHLCEHPLIKDADRAVHHCEVMLLRPEFAEEQYGLSRAVRETYVPMYIRQCPPLATLAEPWKAAEATLNFINYAALLNVK